MILAFHELGCVAISEKGEIIWEYSADDVLEDWSILNDQIILKEMDSNGLSTLNLLTGSRS